MTETVPTQKPRKARGRHMTRGCAVAVCGLMFLVIAAVMFFAGQASWLFFLGVGLATYFSASLPPGAAKRRRRAQLPPAYETAPLPNPPRKHTTRRRIQVPVTQFDEQGHTPLERALHFDDAEQ
jgi:hypothetical protein